MKKYLFSVILLFVLISTSVAQWQRVQTLPTWTYYGGCIDALGDDFAVFSGPNMQLFITSDAGITWTTKNFPQGEGAGDISLVSKNIFYIACLSGKFYKTTDSGNTWVTIFSNPSLSSFGDYIEMFSETTGIAMGDGPSSSLNNGLFLKTTNGTDWKQTCFQTVGFSGDRWTRLDFIDENNGYFYRSGINPEKLLKTTDGGASWTITNFDGRAYGVKFYNKDYGLVSNYNFNTSTNFVDRTTDGGLTWQRFNTAGSQRSSDIEFVPGKPSSVWLGANDGLYFSADSGKTWTQKIPLVRFDDIVFPTANTGWALSPTGYLYYTNNGGGLITNVGQKENLPSSFQLFQNYPNPFNPSTEIKYQIPNSGFVTLKVYDVLGREVATLVNEFRQTGIHRSTFNINNYSLPSGTYFYRLTASDYSSTQKMILLK